MFSPTSGFCLSFSLWPWSHSSVLIPTLSWTLREWGRHFNKTRKSSFLNRIQFSSCASCAPCEFNLAAHWWSLLSIVAAPLFPTTPCSLVKPLAQERKTVLMGHMGLIALCLISLKYWFCKAKVRSLYLSYTSSHEFKKLQVCFNSVFNIWMLALLHQKVLALSGGLILQILTTNFQWSLISMLLNILQRRLSSRVDDSWKELEEIRKSDLKSLENLGTMSFVWLLVWLAIDFSCSSFACHHEIMEHCLSNKRHVSTELDTSPS